MQSSELEELAEAITALAGARKRIPIDHLLRETALNILILSRIVSNRLDDKARRTEIENASDTLVTLIRHTVWEMPRTDKADPPADSSPSE